MKLIRISLIVFLAANLTEFARAQYGLYGSPDSLRMPQQAAAVPYDNYSAPYAGPTVSVPGATTQQVAPYDAPNGYVAQQTPYAAPAANSPSAPVYRTAYASRPYSTDASASPDDLPALNEPGSPQNASLTNQMLNERGQTGVGGSNGYVPPSSTGGACGVGEPSCGVSMGCCYDACPWYVSLSALALARNDANKLWTSYETGNDPNQLMNTQDARTGWKFGGEVRFGRRFCVSSCDPCSPAGYWALEGDYWTTETFYGDASVTNPNTVSTPLRVSDIQFRDINGFNQPGTYWFDNAAEHRLWRHNDIQSVEVNFVRGQWANLYGSNWDFAFSAGPRFFRFEEDLRFGSLRDGATWGQDGGAWEAYLDDRITNNLWGGQIGLDLGYNFGGGALRIYITPKVGIYDNYITNYFQANLGNGTVATTGSSGVPGTYPVSSSTNTFAVMSQADVGLEWFFASRWSARIGYRVLAISGIGLADNQIPPYVVDIPAIADIDTNGDLILHGAFAGLTFNF
ncbi:MAG: BBP7 family outer membrane beta-barrel protein [Pirellulales bacterium]|nr:BBP7 family outer membrane beta-barrel protein [Pirellulales bacterium]